MRDADSTIIDESTKMSKAMTLELKEQDDYTNLMKPVLNIEAMPSSTYQVDQKFLLPVVLVQKYLPINICY